MVLSPLLLIVERIQGRFAYGTALCGYSDCRNKGIATGKVKGIEEGHGSVQMVLELMLARQMWCQVSKDSGEHPCSDCKKGVCCNPIMCDVLAMLRSYADFHCKRCLEENSVQSVLVREVEIEPNVKLMKAENQN